MATKSTITSRATCARQARFTIHKIETKCVSLILLFELITFKTYILILWCSDMSFCKENLISKNIQKISQKYQIFNIFIQAPKALFEIHSTWYFQEIKLWCKKLGSTSVDLVTNTHLTQPSCSKLQKSQISAEPGCWNWLLHRYYSSSWTSLLYESFEAGGKPSTWFTPEGLVE